MTTNDHRMTISIPVQIVLKTTNNAIARHLMQLFNNKPVYFDEDVPELRVKLPSTNKLKKEFA